MDAADGDVIWEGAPAAQNSNAEISTSGESGFGVNRKDLLKETRRSGPWEEVSQEEEKITLKRPDDGKMEGVQKAPELMVSVAQMQKKEEAKKNVVGWFAEKMDEKSSKREVKDTEEMVQWTSIADQMENEDLEKYKVETEWMQNSWSVICCLLTEKKSVAPPREWEDTWQRWDNWIHE